MQKTAYFSVFLLIFFFTTLFSTSLRIGEFIENQNKNSQIFSSQIKLDVNAVQSNSTAINNSLPVQGINIGNALEAPYEGLWGVHIQSSYFDRIKEAGFKLVRLPAKWSGHAAVAIPYTIDPDFFTRIDQIINWALTRNITLILNCHHYDEMATDPQSHRERLRVIWEQIAIHYSNYSEQLVFEIMNEPNGVLDSNVDLWNEIVNETYATIRQSNPTRKIIIGGNSWNAWDHLHEVRFPTNDSNVIATFHYYNPFQFTHQGAEWIENSNQWLGTQWTGTIQEKEAIDSHFDAVVTWSREQNISIFLGEFGAYSRAPLISRVQWTSYIVEAAEKRNFSWAYWEFCSGFGIYNPQTEKWNLALTRALLPNTNVSNPITTSSTSTETISTSSSGSQSNWRNITGYSALLMLFPCGILIKYLQLFRKRRI